MNHVFIPWTNKSNIVYYSSGEFQSIVTANESFSAALLAWNNNWVTLIDGLLQLHVLREPHTAVSVPTRIRTLIIDVPKHEESIKSANTGDKVLLKAEVVEELNVTRYARRSIVLSFYHIQFNISGG